MDPVHVLYEALSDVGHTQTDGPVGVTLQSDHLVCAETHTHTHAKSRNKTSGDKTRQSVFFDGKIPNN